jgi:hypothetical protein
MSRSAQWSEVRARARASANFSSAAKRPCAPRERRAGPHTDDGTVHQNGNPAGQHLERAQHVQVFEINAGRAHQRRDGIGRAQVGQRLHQLAVVGQIPQAPLDAVDGVPDFDPFRHAGQSAAPRAPPWRPMPRAPARNAGPAPGPPQPDARPRPARAPRAPPNPTAACPCDDSTGSAPAPDPAFAASPLPFPRGGTRFHRHRHPAGQVHRRTIGGPACRSR